MTNRTLWRLDGATAATLTQPARLEQGLRLHLQHAELTTVLMRIGAQQQAYLAVQGCEGCAQERCLPGCYVELLRRLLRACGDIASLRPVAGGLAKRPYQRVALAWPTARAEPLADISLAPWSEARVSVHWHGTQRQIACVALLAVGVEGPEPVQALRAAGWRAWTLPASIGAKLANNPIPSSLPFPRAWPHAPALLWPQAVEVDLYRQGQTASAIEHTEITEQDG